MPKTSFLRILALTTLGLLVSCGGGGLTSSSSTTGPGAGDGDGGGGVLFAISDLDGDWTGELLPNNSARGDRNFYLRLLNGELVDSAEGGGGAWGPSSSTLDLEFTTDGFLDLLLDTATSGRLRLQGAMNLALNTINGTFTFTEPDGGSFSGTFELRLSSGSASFPISLLSGMWQGEALNASDSFRLSYLELDDFGGLVSAALTRPLNSEVIHEYEYMANAFYFFDAAIGRLDVLTLNATDGSTLTFTYLLVNDTGTLISGPGEDSVLGVGHVELRRPE